MKRRSFLAALAALPFAGKAIELLSEPAYKHRTVSAGFTTTTDGSLQAAYRKMQGQTYLAFSEQVLEWEDLPDAPDRSAYHIVSRR